MCSKQLEGEATVRKLEEQLAQLKLRLEGYEKIEKELDDIVLQSAQSLSHHHQIDVCLLFFCNVSFQWSMNVMQRECCSPMALAHLFLLTLDGGYSKGWLAEYC